MKKVLWYSVSLLGISIFSLSLAQRLTAGLRIAPNLIFHQSEATLNKIMDIVNAEKKGAYLRFGDGDVNLATGSSDMLQVANSTLTAEMQEAFRLNGSTILKALPLHCRELGGFESMMFPGNHECPYEVCLGFIRKVESFWCAPIKDVYSPVALHYAASYNHNFCIRFLKFMREKSCLFVGNEEIPQHIRELLFGEQSRFVPVPSSQSYSQIDRIEKECLDIINGSTEYKVVVIGMGCSGRILEKRLLGKCDNVFFFDFGSLIDALCGWDTRAWIQLSNFNAQQFLSYLSQEVRVLCTAALLENNFEMRKVEYIKSLESLVSMGYDPYVVEAVTFGGPTFLENYSGHVFYSGVNDARLRNKGVNETRSMLAAIEHFGFKDNDIILKLTGRYHLDSDTFLRLIENNSDVDVFIKKDQYGQVFTGCFAMRCNYLKDMLRQLDLDKMEYLMINLEREVANYIERNKQLKVMEVQTIGVTARIGDSRIAEAL